MCTFPYQWLPNPVTFVLVCLRVGAQPFHLSSLSLAHAPQLLPTMLLPIHRLSSPKAGSFSWLTKRPSFLLNKLIVRWIALACVAIALIWFGGRLANSLSLSPFGFEYPLPNPPLAPHLERPLNQPPQPTKQEQDVWEPRKDEVRNAFKHAWSGYMTIAYPNDELLSVSGGTSNKLRYSFAFALSFHWIFVYKKV